MDNRLENRMENLEKDVGEIKTDTAVLKSDMKIHCENQKSDIQDVKSGIGRIEKLVTNRKREVDATLNKKADKEDVNKLDNRFWGLLIAFIVAMMGIILERIFNGG